MKYGFIGAGNMAGAIIKGMAQQNQAEYIYVCSNTKVSAQKLAKECNCNFLEKPEKVIALTDILVLGVKPHVLPEILPKLNTDIANKNPLVVSIAAGKTIEYLEKLLPSGTAIIRVMPNINAKIGASTSGMCANSIVSPQQKQAVTAMFESIGSVIDVPEEHFSIFSVIGGASVAFAYLYMDALAHGALKAGMPKKQALEITAQTVLGSAKMILAGGEAPWPLIDQVCSPGGTTIEGICKLQELGFESSIIAAFDAVLAKDNALSH